MNEIKDFKFFTAGKAIFTVKNNKGEHYTYKIVKKENTPYFVSSFTGTDNTAWTHYTYLGVFDIQAHEVKLTKASKFALDSLEVKIFNWAVKSVVEAKTLPEGYGILHENYCGKCGRLLTNPESIELGIGPECIKNY
mgnify:CR=1 FL=1